MANKTITDVFVDGARKGWNVAINSMLPNVLMAFVMIQFLKVTGLLDILGKVFAPIMALFGLPGQAVMVLVSAWLSMGGGVGVAASLYSQGILNNSHVTILLPAIILMGAQIQYMGRLLGTAGVQSRFYPMLFGICIVNAMIAMLIMRLFA
ncbi:nucleoside recognition domain protein [Thermosinus carboxydivorans Nor1]|uniref:Nucleoside recognition domain protein n=1 Tax=Thermosinus carboxydivorans Nor1 TaxID=401526 RepID=A1HNK1_9FIRM|nr:YjiG family protein [Thermosinus carboxydivorans]EAX48360.1 nucleoside recognition domain protein [Thermosinus carboxydivorans Nor1]